MYKKQALTLPGTTLPFSTYVDEGVCYVEFNASASEPPEPMMNAMQGLAFIKGTDKRLVMIHVKEPASLYPRIANEMTWSVDVLDNGDVKIIFQNR